MTSLRSMTGYGSGLAPAAGGRVVVEIRSLNHRFIDVRLRMGSPLLDQAGLAEERVRRRLGRGRIEVMARLEGEAGRPVTLDRARARAAYEQLCALRDELRPDEPVPLSLLGCVPDLFGSASPPPSEEVRDALLAATESACSAVDEMREREGAALAADLSERLGLVREHVERLRERVPASVEDYRTKLRERLGRLLKETEITPDPGRIEHEVALFADRSDVAEELTRLAAHCDQFTEIMAGRDGGIGRRLDFLLQEMGREVNTVGAKSADGEATRLVVDLKANIERMREQVQNVL